MLACLAGIILLLEYALSAGNARGVVTAALLAANVVLSDAGLAVLLGTVGLLLGLLVQGSVAGEEVDGQQLIGLALLGGDVWETLQLDESLGTLLVTLVEEAGEGNQAVDILGLELLLVLDQTHCCLHRPVVVPIIFILI